MAPPPADASTTVQCPICGKDVDKLRARAVGIFGGQTYYFCSSEHKGQFKDPRQTPREPAPPPKAKDSAKPAKVKAKEKPKAEAPAPAPAPAAAKEPAPPPADDLDEAPPALRRDPSPSLLEDIDAVRPRSQGRAWLLVVVLFALAGVVLYFALKR